MSLALFAIAVAIVFHALILGKDFRMALDRTALDAGLQAVADGLQALADSIANPPADLGEAQAALDETGAKLKGFASKLTEMKSAEDTEDAG